MKNKKKRSLRVTSALQRVFTGKSKNILADTLQLCEYLEQVSDRGAFVLYRDLQMLDKVMQRLGFDGIGCNIGMEEPYIEQQSRYSFQCSSVKHSGLWVTLICDVDVYSVGEHKEVYLYPVGVRMPCITKRKGSPTHQVINQDFCYSPGNTLL